MSVQAAAQAAICFSLARGSSSLQYQVAPRDGLLVFLREQHGADDPDDGRLVGEDGEPSVRRSLSP
jgi:hypothetical protein